MPFYIPAREPDDRLVVRHAMRTHHNRLAKAPLS